MPGRAEIRDLLNPGNRALKLHETPTKGVPAVFQDLPPPAHCLSLTFSLHDPPPFPRTFAAPRGANPATFVGAGPVL